MNIYYPALLASAIFFGAFVVNMRDNNYRSSIFICLFAIPSIIFLAYLSKRNLDLIGYVLILVPVILLYLGFTMGIQTSSTNNNTTSTTVLTPTITSQTSNLNTITTGAVAVAPDRIESTNWSDFCHKCKQKVCKCKKHKVLI